MKINLYNLEKWERTLLYGSFITIIILGLCSIFSDTHSFFSELLISLATGVIASILILYLQRSHRSKQLLNAYEAIAGNYIRTEIGQDNTPDDKSINLREENVGLKISLTYLGENKFSADMEFWKKDNAKAIAYFEFSETNKMIASGTYEYYQGEKHKGHFGTLELFRFQEQPHRLYVKYQHVFPRRIENNPDQNRGWQVWERKLEE